jgi:hypothetical protein
METLNLDYRVSIRQMLKDFKFKVNASIKLESLDLLDDVKDCVEDLEPQVFAANRSEKSHWCAYVGVRTSEVRDKMEEVGFRNATLKEVLAFGFFHEGPINVRILDCVIAGLPGYIPFVEKTKYNIWLTLDKNNSHWDYREKFLGIRK